MNFNSYKRLKRQNILDRLNTAMSQNIFAIDRLRNGTDGLKKVCLNIISFFQRATEPQ